MTARTRAWTRRLTPRPPVSTIRERPGPGRAADQGGPVPRASLSPAPALAAALLAAACASPLPAKDAAMTLPNATRGSTNLQPVKEWPLKFERHSFSAFTYDTYGARVEYAGQVQLDEPDDVLQRSSDSYGVDYQRNWTGTHGGIRNFPEPARVRWRSKDGAAHAATIDFARIFAAQEVLHLVPRDDVAEARDGQRDTVPSILLEINDRTVRVYMRAMVYTRTEQVPGNPLSTFRNDLVLAKTLTF
ncbi:hypothetical protein SD81_035760 [Tolypothrix campylonemoides VB511288]|nr:hypothetical protein SD81_035760 [Tolypothrix campylonemoides VB511288]